jgi:hypothetical protein
MAARIDPATLSRADAESMLAESLHGEDMARLAAGMARGAAKRRAVAIASQHLRNAHALADRLYGAPSADVLAMSDDALLRELTT